jgi:uncharacterized protein YndB with AHSA1/START domain
MSVRDELKQQNLEIRKTIIIEASPEIVFKAITEPEEITQWFQYADQAIVEPKVGGKFRLIALDEVHPEWKLGRDYVMQGTIKEFVPNKKLSYTWKFDDMPDFPETIVTWELDEIEHNRTKLELTHSGFTGKEKGNFSIEGHTRGWTEALSTLAKQCQGKE